MTTPTWQKPTKGNNGPRAELVKLPEFEGALLGVKPKVFIEDDFNYGHETKDAVHAEITVFDGPKAGEVIENGRLNAGRLVVQLKDNIDGAVLGRLQKVSITKKDGKKITAWSLEDPTDEDFETAAAAETPPY